ncbi:MAG: hypothetical protein ACREB5_02680 [Sphingomonadaceae bacterium]
MSRPTGVYTINYFATLIGQHLELLQEVVSNSDNIDLGEMIHAHDGTEEGITTLTDRGIIVGCFCFLSGRRRYECCVGSGK